MHKVKAIIFSDYSNLSGELARELIKDGCVVYVVSKDENWKGVFGQSAKQKLFFNLKVSPKDNDKFDYCIIFSRKEGESYIASAKTLVILEKETQNAWTTPDELTNKVREKLFGFGDVGEAITVNVPLKKKEEIEKKAEEVALKPAVKKKGPFIFLAAALLFWAVISPFLVLFVSAVSLKMSWGAAKTGDFERARVFLQISQRSANLGKKVFIFLSPTPFLGTYSSKLAGAEYLIELAAFSLEKGITASEELRGLVDKILKKTEFNVTEISDKLSLDFATLYKQISFLQSEIDTAPFSTKAFLANPDELIKIRKKAGFVRDVAKSLPLILGEDRVKTYLVLLQNNMELRPTGGFIGSFALVSFEKGSMIDFQVFDVYSADGQLKGHVEPPEPIRKYLGEANWYLRDSNWDVDFSVSAKRAEWFLEKELDRQVDGVAGITLEAVKSLLSATGPIELSDFGQTLDEYNLYERLQYEVESDFFPGSRKKANLLSALSMKLFDKLSDMPPKQEAKAALLFAKNLESRDVQFYFNENAVQEALDLVGWSGRVSVPPDAVFSGLVEANLGVNKANYFIERSVVLSVDTSDDKITQTLEVDFRNTAPEVLGLSGKYKAYIRAMGDKTSSFGKARIVRSGREEGIDPEVSQLGEYKEAGVFFELSPGQTARIVFSWEQPSFGQTDIFFWKQGGVKEYPFTLTIAGVPLYNTSASGDVKLNQWQQNQKITP